MSRHSRFLVACGLAILTACGDATAPTILAGPPASLQIVSGDLQADTVGKELPEALIVRVVDSAGTPVPLQVINFRVVSGGGSVFAGVGLTDTLGLAQERWTLGEVAGDSQKVEARAVDSQTGEPLVFGTFTAIGVPDAPATITKLVGDLQAGAAGAALTDSLSVKITDQYGNPTPGQTVTWTVTAGGGTVTSSSSTGLSGIAKAEWTLGTQVGADQTVTAEASGLATITFTASPTVPATATLAAVAGDGQSGPAGEELPNPLVAEVKLADGRPVLGTTVTWTIVAGGGALSTESSITDGNGQATTEWTLGTSTGAQRVRAGVLGLSPVEYTVSSEAGPPTNIVRVSGNAQFGELGEALGDSLAVRVTDSHGNIIPGETVAWTVLAGEGTITITGETDASGTARAEWVLGARLDTTHVATATSAGLSPVEFTATPRLPTDAVISKASGDAQTDTVATAIEEPITVEVELSDGTPVWGVEIRFAHTSVNGGSVSPSSISTDATGQASATWTIGTLAGANTATATVTGLDVSTVTFTATGIPDIAATVEVAPRTATDSALFFPPDTLLTGDSLSYVAHAYDEYGNLKSEAVVDWSSSDESVASVVSEGSVEALTEGTASVEATVDTATGTSAIVVQLRLPITLELLAGSGQSDTVDATLPTEVEVRALDRRATPFEGAEITFRGTNGAPTDTSAGCSCKIVDTDADGVASTQWVLGINAGEAIMHALGEPPGGGNVFDSLTVSATVIHGDSSSVSRVSGGGADPSLVIAVRDRHGNPVPGTWVPWSITAGTGELLQASSTSDSNGLVTNSVISATTDITVEADASGLAGSPVVFNVDAIVPDNIALDFSQSWVTVPDHADLDLSTTWTIEAWIKPRDVLSGSFQHIVSKWNGGGDASYTMTVSTNGRLRSGVHNGTTNTILESTVLLTDDVWQHVVVTFDNGVRQLYIDGVLDTTQTGAVTPMNSTRPLSFGREGPPYGGWRYDGLIDEVRIWGVARTGTEIANNMNLRLTGNETGLVGYWRFDEGSGDTAFDATGNGHSGQLGNSVGVDANDPQWTTDSAPIP